ncbi:MAG: hypothetical protein JHC93_06675 [Parachlamydiales bacterium]|nr:hypothetical protein [Parachlamydiales bacterium]
MSILQFANFEHCINSKKYYTALFGFNGLANDLSSFTRTKEIFKFIFSDSRTLVAKHLTRTFCRLEEGLYHDQEGLAYKIRSVTNTMLGQLQSSEEKTELYRHFTSFLYREGTNAKRTKPLVEDSNIKNTLIAEAIKWKSNEPLTQQEIDSIEKLCDEYNFTAQTVLASSLIRKRCFNWILDKHLPIDVFACFPKISANLQNCHLDDYIDRHGGLTYDQNNVRLDTPDGYINLTKSTTNHGHLHAFSFAGLKLTLPKIYKIFQDKYKAPQILSYTDKGLENFNSSVLGSWNPMTKKYNYLDLSNKNWHEKLPITNVLITKDQLQQQFNILPNGKTVAVMMSTDPANKDDAHTWINVYEPTQDQNIYQLKMQLGKMQDAPSNIFKRFINFIKHKGAVDVIDFHDFDTSIKKSGVGFTLNADTLEGFYALIAKHIQLTRNGTETFKKDDNDSAQFCYNLLTPFCKEQLIQTFGADNQFEKNLNKAKMNSPFQKMIRIHNRLPQFLRKPFLRVSSYFFNTWKKKTI